MPAMPAEVVAYKQTRRFTDADVPDGLVREHSTRAGVWGRLDVLEGALRYHILEGEGLGVYPLRAGEAGVIMPAQLHRVELIGPVTFQITFHR